MDDDRPIFNEGNSGETLHREKKRKVRDEDIDDIIDNEWEDREDEIDEFLFDDVI